MLVGEDEVPPRGGVVGLEDAGGGHGVDSRTSHFSQQPHRPRALDNVPPRCHRRSATTSTTTSRRSRSTSPTRATRCPTRCSTTLIEAFELARDDDVGALRRPHLHAREGLLLRRQPRRLRGRGAARAQALRHRPLPAAVPADRRARQADDLRGQRARARRRARARAGVRPDRRARGRALRDARDQRRGVPVHDHGADLPQRRAQEDERAAAARRADRRARRPSGSGSSTTSCRPRSSTAPSATGRAGSPPSRRC